MQLPPTSILADLFRQLPALVVHMTTDGIVLHCNPETTRLTEFPEHELIGQNFWTLLFPGKLFAQVPRFISLVNPSPLLKDTPMTLRTRSGGERVVAFRRYFHTPPADAGDSAPRTMICVGLDLTDRLLDADRSGLPETQAADVSRHTSDDGDVEGFVAFGPHIGNAGAIDGEIVTPIAISPRPIGGPGHDGPCPIEQVREGLARVETQIHCVQGVFDQVEQHTLSALRQSLSLSRAPAFHIMARSDSMQLAFSSCLLDGIHARVAEMSRQHSGDLP